MPASFKVAKAMNDTLKITATPEATRKVWPISPVQSPRVITNPAILPRMADWESTKMLSGPGARAIRMHAEKKTASMLMGINISLFKLPIFY